MQHLWNQINRRWKTSKTWSEEFWPESWQRAGWWARKHHIPSSCVILASSQHIWPSELANAMLHFDELFQVLFDLEFSVHDEDINNTGLQCIDFVMENN